MRLTASLAYLKVVLIRGWQLWRQHWYRHDELSNVVITASTKWVAVTEINLCVRELRVLCGDMICCVKYVMSIAQRSVNHVQFTDDGESLSWCSLDAVMTDSCIKLNFVAQWHLTDLFCRGWIVLQASRQCTSLHNTDDVLIHRVRSDRCSSDRLLELAPYCVHILTFYWRIL